MNKTTHILIVDDEPAVRELFTFFLQNDGYQVSNASTGRQALECLGTKKPDMVLLDVMLPDISGLDVCRKIKSDSALMDTFVVLLSGQAISPEHKVEGLGAGADDYLSKPLSVEELRARVQTLVRLQMTTAALRASEQHYRRLVEILPDAVSLVDFDGVISESNQQTLTMLGFEAVDELRQRSLFDFTPPHDRARLQADLYRAQSTGSLRHAEYTFIRKNGEPFPVEVSVGILRGGTADAAGLVCVVHEITERKRAEAQIRLLADAIQSVQELVCITDEQNCFRFVNRAFLEAYGYTEAEVLSRRPDLLYSEKNPPGLCGHVFQETLRGGWRGEILNRRKDGSEFPISLCTSRILNKEGRTLGLVGVARDISDRKREEKRTNAFTELGYRLSGAVTPDSAAHIILEIASELFGWDAGYVHLYSPEADMIVPVLTVDTREGRHEPVSPATFTLEPTPFMRQVMKGGARMLLRDESATAPPGLVRFGDTHRLSASLMHVPIRSGGAALGVLSIQSYQPRAYSKEDLRLLQTLADHCGDALQRIKVQENLRKSDAKYRSIVENAIEGIFQSTSPGRYTSANSAMARMLGYASPEELISGVRDMGQVFIFPEQGAELKARLDSEPAVQGFETEWYRKDRTRIWVRINAHAVRDTDGSVLFYEGTSLDITAGKWAENSLQTQRDFGVFLSSVDNLAALARELLEIAGRCPGIDCVAVYFEENNTGALDLAAQRGLSPEFEANAAHLEIGAGRTRAAPRPIPPAGQARDRNAALLQALGHEQAQGTEIVKIRQGKRVLGLVAVGSRSGPAIPAKSKALLEAIIEHAGNAVGRIKAEQLLRSNRALLEQALHSLRAAVLVVEAESGIILECNPAANRIFGYLREEMVGRSVALLHLDEVRHQEFIVHLHAATRAKGFLADFEFKMRRKDGTNFVTEQSVVPVRNDADRVVSWVNLVRDITDQKQAEEEARQLPRRIIEAQENERLRVARELHDGVNQIIAAAHMRLRKVESRLAAAHPAAREMLARCDELLVQALEENRRIAHDLRPSDLDTLGLVEACHNFCREFQARTNLKLNCDIAADGERLDPTTELNLFRITQEALNNIEKHAQAKNVLLRLVFQPDFVLLRIEDDGCGFSPAPAIKRKKGHGLGLTNMRERARSLGGIFEVESAPKGGTIIIVRVPRNRGLTN